MSANCGHLICLHLGTMYSTFCCFEQFNFKRNNSDNFSFESNVVHEVHIAIGTCHCLTRDKTDLDSFHQQTRVYKVKNYNVDTSLCAFC